MAEQQERLIPADVYMISGCKDSQTSADVGDTSAFGLGDDAGGACTSSFVQSLRDQRDCSWVELLKSMRNILRGGYTQIPQLCTSAQLNLKDRFSLVGDNSSGRCRSVLIGINYVGQSGELSGCHNDVHTMREFLISEGFSEDNMWVLMDDGEHDNPTHSNISDAMDWLVEGAAAGDALFFHYSGHGASVADDNGDEADGKDEALCPVDYQEEGLIRDDKVYVKLVGPLPEGARMFCVMDCCHSGTILDLPYLFSANDSSLQAVEDGQMTSIPANAEFNPQRLYQLIQENPAAYNAARKAIEMVAGQQVADLLKADGAPMKTLCSCLQVLFEAKRGGYQESE
eukprot:TRINITY_DN51494_c0_g2_i1.p1 TRINITY_DN51494_c0_g2~~TRINITY_DN51494_c0_g2_i1.p1  ORF type:complete len:342 (-),score=60.84 TRINITY_DN51494_c0_g2_i1:364-1389(-)